MKNPIIKRLAPILSGPLIGLLAIALGFLFYQHFFRVFDTDVLDSAQIARNIAQGHGFSTDVIDPDLNSILSVGKSFNRAPNVVDAPLFPFLLGLVFTFLGEKDGVVIGFSLLLFALSAFLLFHLVKRVSGKPSWAAAIAVAYSFSVPVLTSASTGQSQALISCLLLLMLLALTPKPELPDIANPDSIPGSIDEIGEATTSEGAVGLPLESAQKSAQTSPPPEIMGGDDTVPAKPIPIWRQLQRHYIWVGMLASLCYLSDYMAPFYVLPLALLWGRGAQNWKRPAVLSFLLGFVLVALPWWIRCARLTGNPFYSTPWLILVAEYSNPAFLLQTLPSGLKSFIYGAATIPHLYLMPFIVVSLWIRSGSKILGNIKAATWIALLCTILGLSVFGRGNPSELVPLAPLLTFLGLITFFQIIEEFLARQSTFEKMEQTYRFEQRAGDPSLFSAFVKDETEFAFPRKVAFAALRNIGFPLLMRDEDGKTTFYSGQWTTKTVLKVRSVVLLLLLLAGPAVARIALSKPAKPFDIRAAMQPLVKAIPADRIIVTNSPQIVSWYANSLAIPLPEHVRNLVDWKDNPKIGALYLSSLGLTPDRQEWRPLYGQVELPGFERITRPGSQNTVYVKQPTLEETQSLVAKQPQNAVAYLSLGQALMQNKRPTEALTAFKTAQRLAPTNVDTFTNAGLADLSTHNLAAAQQEFAAALKVAPRSTAALMGMAQLLQSSGKADQAIPLYERALADFPNYSLALNNLAQLYADNGQNLYRALELSRRAVNQDPNNGSIIDTLGEVCLQLGYHDEALGYLEQAAKLSPKNPDILMHLKQAKNAAGLPQR